MRLIEPKRAARIAALFAAMLVPALAACSEADGSDGGSNPPPASGTIELRYDFNQGDHDWEGGFADYSPAHADMNLDFGLAPLPDSLEEAGTGFRLVGMNRSDDLFMFLKRRIGADEGVQPGQQYRVSYRIVVASDAATGCFGVGGAPGESVFLKAGAVAEEPEVELDAMDHWRMTVDIGNQAEGGVDAGVAGDIANGIECEEAMEAGFPHAEIERTYTHDHLVTAGEDGTLWLIVGTDSGFEGQTELYYRVVEATLEAA